MELEYREVKVGGITLRLFKDLGNARLPYETFQEFRMRRKFVHDEVTERKKYGIKGQQIKKQENADS